MNSALVSRLAALAASLLGSGLSAIAMAQAGTQERPTNEFPNPAAGANARILKFDSHGRFLKAWGRKGTGPGELDQPHALAIDSRGRLFVGDRSNNRIQIFDQDGIDLTEWTQFSRPSGIAIGRNDTIYVADSESGSVALTHSAWKRGIRIGNARDGRVTGFIPDPNEKATGTSAAEGIAVDSRGVVYGAEVGPRALKRYIRQEGTRP